MKVYGHTHVGVRGQLGSLSSAMWVPGIERKPQALWYHPAYANFYFETIRTPLPQLRLIPTYTCFTLIFKKRVTFPPHVQRNEKELT